jgi:hypothetical protein
MYEDISFWVFVFEGVGEGGVCPSSFTKVVNRLGGAETHTAGIRCHLQQPQQEQPHPARRKRNFRRFPSARVVDLSPSSPSFIFPLILIFIILIRVERNKV